MLTHEDVEEILQLLDATPVEQFELETAHFKLTLRRSTTGAGRWTQERQSHGAADMLPASGSDPTASVDAAAPAAAPAAVDAEPAADDGRLEVRAPLVGSFYRAPKPGAAPTRRRPSW